MRPDELDEDERTTLTEAALGEAALDPLPDEEDEPDRGKRIVTSWGRVLKRYGRGQS